MMEDSGTEAEYLSDWDDYSYEFEDEDDYELPVRPTRSQDRGGDREQKDRWRCLTVGCNPVLNADTARDHKEETEHRVAKWPVRSPEGKRRARQRNKTGYYDKYNVGEKSAEARAKYIT